MDDVNSKEISIQTETHPIPSNIVEGYSWNEWELRRRAIILSKVHTSTTHGTQTYEQSLKKSSGTQSSEPRDQGTQANVNVHVQTQLPSNQWYFYGLRGHHDDIPPHIVDLTIESVKKDDDMPCPPDPDTSKETSISEQSDA